jgi:hypothetical protein
MKLLRKSLKKAGERSKAIFWILFCLIFATALSYGYFVSNAVVSVMRRGAAEKERSALASAMGELEARYLTEKRGVTAAVARAHGFEDARIARFISKKTVTAFRSGSEL